MRIRFHFTELTSRPDPRKESFYLDLKRLDDVKHPVVNQLGEMQASMMSARLRRPMIYSGVEYLDIPATEEGSAVTWQVHTWAELINQFG